MLIERFPLTRRSSTPDLVTVSEGRRQNGSTPAGGGAGTAAAPCGSWLPPPLSRRGEGTDRVIRARQSSPRRQAALVDEGRLRGLDESAGQPEKRMMGRSGS